jgi:hypothetical protein
MKRHLFFLLSVLSSTLFSQSIPNGGFEGWTITNYENPKFFQTCNFERDEAVVQVNAVKTSDAYHGSYSIKLTTSAVSSGTKQAFAWFSNFSPSGGYSPGGIPYAQKPTGVRFHYKSNILAGDTAIFLCMFKKNGVQIGFYLYKIATTQTSWTLFDSNFSPPLGVTPDSVGIACASSIAFNNPPYQVGNSIQVDSILFKGVTSQPANFNGDFEQWLSLSQDRLNNLGLEGEAHRTTDVYTGNYALELQTKGPDLNNPQVEPGRLFTSQNAPGGEGGIPYSTQIDTLVLHYKYLPADPNDKARIYLFFKKNGMNVNQTFTLLPISASYTRMVIPFNVGQVPDSINFSVESSNWPTQASYVGSDLKIDNIYLTSQKMPISDCIVPAFGCVGQPVQLTDNSANMANAWGWIMPGGTPGSSTAQNPVVTYYSVGTKTITMVSNNQFGAGSPVSRTITIYAVPPVASTSTITGCGGGNVVLTASGASTYTWSTGANTATINVTPSVTTVYTVEGTTNGCVNMATGAVIVPAVPKPDICMVTVDSLNQYNEIYWDKAAYSNLDSMIIYREVISNTYKRIGAVSKNALSMWVDTARSIGPANGDPNISTYRYKIQIRDTCGVYGPKSLWHNTVYFSHTNGTFFWTNNYMIEGPINPVQTYSLMVCQNPTVSPAYTIVGTTTGNQSTLNDNFYSTYSLTADWRVFADLGYNCNATQKVSVTKATKSRSNVQNNRTAIGINEASFKNRIRVYPNPTPGNLNVELLGLNEDVDLNMTNVLGQSVYSEKVNKGIAVRNINTSAFSKGIYTLTVNSSSGKAVYKIVVE